MTTTKTLRATKNGHTVALFTGTASQCFAYARTLPAGEYTDVHMIDASPLASPSLLCAFALNRGAYCTLPYRHAGQHATEESAA